jgi:hypothetical protein
MANTAIDLCHELKTYMANITKVHIYKPTPQINHNISYRFFCNNFLYDTACSIKKLHHRRFLSLTAVLCV